MTLKTEARDVSGFSEVAVRGFGDAMIVQGDHEGLVIEADEEILPRISSEVRDGQLVLGLDLAWWEWLTWWFTWIFMTDKRVRYTVTLCDFSGASISGSGKILSDNLEGEACRFSISGSGTMVIDNLTAQSIGTRISGSGDIRMAGRAEKQQIYISGSGSVQNSDLETADTDIHISGAGKASINASRSLGIDISGSGSVFYRGQPQVRQHISGTGRVGASH